MGRSEGRVGSGQPSAPPRNNPEVVVPPPPDPFQIGKRGESDIDRRLLEQDQKLDRMYETLKSLERRMVGTPLGSPGSNLIPGAPEANYNGAWAQSSTTNNSQSLVVGNRGKKSKDKIKQKEKKKNI